MTVSQEIRHDVIAIITDALQNPEMYGDRFFVQLVGASDRGYMPVTLVHSMIAQLKDIPVSYIEYCADKEPDRLQLSIDRTKIRIARQDEPELNNAHETDPYGHAKEDHQATAAATATVVHKKSKFFRPYTPSFVSQPIAAPIFYDDGKFFDDTEELSKRVREDRPRMEVPPYAKLEIDALGDPRARESLNVCWNCGSEEHSYSACPEPRDDEMIKYYREKTKKKSSGPANTGRFFVELALKNKVAELNPGRLSLELQDALGMNNRHSEPPYYVKMRQHGYPPGFWGTPKEKDVLLSRWKNPTAWSEELLYDNVPDLKIYDDNASYEKDDGDSQDAGPVRVGTNERVKLVHYPNLDWRDELRNRSHTTKATPHLTYTYAPAYYYAEQPTAPHDSTTAQFTTLPTAPPQQPQLPPPPPPSSYYYYDSYYPAYPYTSYPPPVHSNPAKPELPLPPPPNPSNATELEDGEIAMDASDDDVDMDISEDDD